MCNLHDFVGGALPKVIAQPRLENLAVLQFLFFGEGTVRKTFGHTGYFYADFEGLTVLLSGGGMGVVLFNCV